MYPSGSNTTPEQRFFLNLPHEIECHESVDVSELPRVEVMDGADAFAIIEEPEGGEIAYNLNDDYTISPGSVVTKITVLNPRDRPHKRHPFPHYEPDQFSIFEGKAEYVLQEGDLLIVRLERHKLEYGIDHGEISKDGTIVVESGKPLPSLAGEGLLHSDEKDVNYSLLGVITAEDKLLVWDWNPNYIRNLIDLCATNTSAQNGLEHALVVKATDQMSLVGKVSVAPVVTAYLAYFGNKYGKAYIPLVDPDQELDRFPPLSDQDKERRRALARIASQLNAEREE